MKQLYEYIDDIVMNNRVFLKLKKKCKKNLIQGSWNSEFDYIKYMVTYIVTRIVQNNEISNQKVFVSELCQCLHKMAIVRNE